MPGVVLAAIVAAAGSASAVQITPLMGAVTTTASADVNVDYNVGGGGHSFDINNSTSGAPISGSLTAPDNASYLVDPTTGLAQLQGVSRPVNYGAVAPDTVSSQVHGDMQIAAHITFSGTLPTFGTGILTVHYGGLIEPNVIYENNSDNAHGGHFNSVTAIVTGSISSFGGHSSQSETFESNSCTGIGNCTTSLDMTGSFDLPFEVIPSQRVISVELQMQGAGYEGGGFSFDPYFTIAFDDPLTSVTYTGTSGFFKTTTAATPLPSSLLLLLSGLGGFAVFGAYRRRTDNSSATFADA